jgi:hypothetical protein
MGCNLVLCHRYEADVEVALRQAEQLAAEEARRQEAAAEEEGVWRQGRLGCAGFCACQCELRAH